MKIRHHLSERNKNKIIKETERKSYDNSSEKQIEETCK